MRLSRDGAWRRWQRAAGPWVGWAICPALTMPLEGLPGPGAGADWKEAWPLAPELERILLHGGVALVLDLAPAAGVPLAAEISRRRLAHVVLVLPRWPHLDAVLPSDQLIATLLGCAAALTRDAVLDNVVFVLDGERQRLLPNRPRNDPRVDNRYALTAADLPPLAKLHAAHIERVVKLASA